MADYNEQQKKRNIVVGAFVMFGFIAFLWMIYIFGELPIAMARLGSFQVIAKFPSAPGIQANTPVMFLGYQVGRVLAVSAPQKKSKVDGVDDPHHEISVTMLIESQFSTIPSNVDVMVMKRSMGSSYIDLQYDPERPLTPQDPSNPKTAYLCKELKKPLTGGTGFNNEFFPKEVQQKLEKLIETMISLTSNADEIIGDEANKTNVKKTLANITDATAQAKTTLASIEKFSDRGSQQVEEVSEQLSTSLKDLRNILAKINESDSTASKLLNDGRLYENLLDSSQELQMALEQLKILAAEARENGIKLKF